MPFEPVSVAAKISAHNLDFIFGAVVPGNKNVKIRVLDHKLNQNIPYPILPDTSLSSRVLSDCWSPLSALPLQRSLEHWAGEGTGAAGFSDIVRMHPETGVVQ